MIRELSQAEKVKNHMISHTWDVKLKATHEKNKKSKQNIINTDTSMVVTRGRGVGDTKG